VGEVDIIVVGAGTAGSVLAARLTQAPGLTVALVEAGGVPADLDIADPLKWPFLQGRKIDWGFSTVPQPGTAGRVHAWPRGRVRGGSSVLNAMAHVRGHPADFDGWAAAGCAGWGFADLLPYFIRSEHWTGRLAPWHGEGGPVHLMQPASVHPLVDAFRAAAAELGIAATDEHNGPRMAGPTVNTLTIVGGRRQSTADAYLTPEVLTRPGLRLVENARVLALDFEGRRCVGVTAATGSGPLRLAARSRVVLAAGTVGSPHLLMLAGIGDAADLAPAGVAVRVHLPGVGAGLQDHLLAAGNLYRARRPVPPSRLQHSESLMYLDGAGGGPAPGLVIACVVLPVVTEAFAAPEAGTAYTLMAGFTHPASRGRIRLPSADPLAAPLIDPCYLAEAADAGAFLDALDAARALGATRAMGGWRDAELLPGPGCRTKAERAAFLAGAALTHHHPVGTCRMGTDAAAVVGPDLAVHGVDGLCVVDASIFPTLTTGPTNAAVIAIAERAADRLAGRAPLPPMAPPW
jgi:choline dehydrogenase-like flavoprotein